MQFNQHNGGMPSASELRALSEIVPDAANRFIIMMESEQRQDHDVAGSMMAERRRGQYIGGLLILLALATSGFCSYVGDHVTASIIGGATITTLAAVYVLGKLPEQRQPAKK